MEKKKQMIRKYLLMAAATFLYMTGIAQVPQVPFDTFFEKKSLRIDFALSGNAEGQRAAIEQLREEPTWGGPLVNLVDHFHYGGYYVHIYDKTSGELIYSKGFNTLFEEWLTTDQAHTETQSWTNSISVPFPKRDIIFELSARNRDDMQFYPLLKMDISPESIFIDRGALKNNHITQLSYQGDSNQKVDLVFLAEGYRADEQEKFVRDARRFMEALFRTAPFSEHKADFNVWAVGVGSEDSGTDLSGKGIFKNTALNSGFYTFGIDRYLTTRDMKSIRDAVWNVPNDALFILINTDMYGGGGMYNFYACGTADNERTPVVFTHEFGHSFAGLADEYFSSEVAYNDFYNLKREPWEPNITTLVDFDTKWKDLVATGIPIPTPVDDSTYKDKCGVFEGGGYVAKGIYRPMDHCMMRDYAPFCPACSRAIERMIRYYCDEKY